MTIDIKSQAFCSRGTVSVGCDVIQDKNTYKLLTILKEGGAPFIGLTNLRLAPGFDMSVTYNPFSISWTYKWWPIGVAD